MQTLQYAHGQQREQTSNLGTINYHRVAASEAGFYYCRFPIRARCKHHQWINTSVDATHLDQNCKVKKQNKWWQCRCLQKKGNRREIAYHHEGSHEELYFTTLDSAQADTVSLRSRAVPTLLDWALPKEEKMSLSPWFPSIPAMLRHICSILGF